MTPKHNSIRTLNDALRQHHRGGLVVLTPGIQAFGPEGIREINRRVAAFDSFTPDNDPYGEHDFGWIEIPGNRVLFKIDYYDLDLSCLSPDPADPAVTRRVLTLMLAEEY